MAQAMMAADLSNSKVIPGTAARDAPLSQTQRNPLLYFKLPEELIKLLLATTASNRGQSNPTQPAITVEFAPDSKPCKFTVNGEIYEFSPKTEPDKNVQVYRATTEANANGEQKQLQFVGYMTERATLTPVVLRPKRETQTRGKAAAAPKKTAEKEARKAIILSEPDIGSRSSSRKGRPSAAATSSLQVTLPEFSAPPLGLNLRSKLIRNLACEAWELPALKQVLISSSEADIKDELQDIAVLDGRGRYQLLDERFADVRPYEWGYTVAERKKALEHMQDAFDRLGFAPDAVERQRLVDPSTIPLVSVTSDKRKAAAVPVTKDETEGAAGDKATPAKRVKAAGAVATLKKKGATAKGKKAAEVDMSKVANHSIKYAEKGVEKKGGSEGAAGESWAGRGRSTRASAKRDQHAEDDQGEPGEVLEFPAKKMPTSTFGYRRNAASPELPETEADLERHVESMQIDRIYRLFGEKQRQQELTYERLQQIKDLMQPLANDERGGMAGGVHRDLHSRIVSQVSGWNGQQESDRGDEESLSTKLDREMTKYIKVREQARVLQNVIWARWNAAEK